MTVTAAATATGKMLNVQQVAKHLGLSVKTVRELCTTGGLRHIKVGRQYRIAESWLHTWAESRSVGGS